MSDASHFFVAGARKLEVGSILEGILSDAHIRTKSLSLPGAGQLDEAMAEMVKTTGLESQSSAKVIISESLRQWNLHGNVLSEYEETIREARIREVCDLMEKYAITLEQLRTHCREVID
jgi:hypothetical protein